MGEPHLLMAELDVGNPTASAEALSLLVTRLLLDDIVKGRVRYLVVVTFTPRGGRLWQLHDAPAPDDVARALVEREGAVSIAFVHPCPVPPEVDAERCYQITAESPEGKHDQIVALKGGAGLGGDMFRLYSRAHPKPRYTWLGVPPQTPLELSPEEPLGLWVGTPEGQA